MSVKNWNERFSRLALVADRQLFFVGGAPRSGTTWLQHLLDSHPEVSCRGEGLFQRQLAAPLDGLLTQRRQALEVKNSTVFGQIGGYPLPTEEDVDAMLALAILLALHRQCDGRTYAAIGEKTPENIFLFPRLKRLFPQAKFIGIVRDPRDALTSAWHFFHRPTPGPDATVAKTHFIRAALAPLNEGARAMIRLAEHYPADCLIITYEALLQEPLIVATRLFGFLGVADHEPTVLRCIEQASFPVMAAAREPGLEQRGSFFRSGTQGGWVSTLTPEMNAMVLETLGWMFPHFGWQA